LWHEIADFADANTLGQVCRRLRKMFARRVKAICEAAQKLQHIASVLGKERFLSAVVLAAPYLHTLTLDPKATIHNGSDFQDTQACALAQEVKRLPSLKNLTLRLEENSIGKLGASQLAALKCAPSLNTLSLDIHCQSMRDSWSQALAVLQDAPLLHSLTLCVQRNALAYIRTPALSALKHAPSLQTLPVQLEEVEAQTPIKEVSALHALTLNVGENSVDDVGAMAFTALHDTPSLHSLTLHLCRTARISPRYFEDLDEWIWVHCPLSWDDFEGWVWVPSHPVLEIECIPTFKSVFHMCVPASWICAGFALFLDIGSS
jgi:hypothetical protein